MFSKGRNVVTKLLDLLTVDLDCWKRIVGKTENYAMDEKYFMNLSTQLNILSLLTNA